MIFTNESFLNSNFVGDEVVDFMKIKIMWNLSTLLVQKCIIGNVAATKTLYLLKSIRVEPPQLLMGLQLYSRYAIDAFENFKISIFGNNAI